jgi:hypothetical protein
MDEQYEQGYQDGQADLEQEFTNALQEAFSANLSLDNVAGHQTMTMTVHTTANSLLAAWLIRHFKPEATESVVGLGDQMLNSHKTDQKPTERDIHLANCLEKIEEMFGPNGTHHHQVTRTTMSDELTI